MLQIKSLIYQSYVETLNNLELNNNKNNNSSITKINRCIE